MVQPTTVKPEDIKSLVASKLDVSEFLDLLGWTMYDLVEQIDPQVFEDHFDDLMEACD